MKELARKVFRLEENSSRFDGNMSKMEGRMSNMEGKISQIEGRMARMEESISRIEENMSRLINYSLSTRAMLEGVAVKADENFRKIDERLNKIEGRLNVLTNETSNNFSEVGDQLGGIKAEITKISAATRYEQYHEDQKKFNLNN